MRSQRPRNPAVPASPAVWYLWCLARGKYPTDTLYPALAANTVNAANPSTIPHPFTCGLTGI
jgi:hypothetical protein